jgi:DNA primase
VNVFDALKQQVGIEEVVTRNGRDNKVRCVSPDHHDETPSMHLYADHVFCFGCGFHGDVVDVWGAQKGIDRPIEAALDLAQEFNVRLPEFSEEARQKAQEHRQKQDRFLKLARACHNALENHWAADVRAWWDGRGFGDEERKRFLLGTNKHATEAVIPFWRGGRVEGIIRRKLEGEPKYLVTESGHFPGGHKPLFIPAPLKAEIFLVEGYIDALAVAATGRAVVSGGGTGVSEAQISELRRFGKIFILPDRDVAGEKAAEIWARTLYPAARICPADYGEGRKDVADLFAATTSDGVLEHLNRLVEASTDILDVEMQIAKEIDERRGRLAYMAKNIAPLLVPLQPDGHRDATADIVAETVGLKKSWITNAIKDEHNRLLREAAETFGRQAEAAMKRQEEQYRQKVAEAQGDIDELLAPGVLTRLRDTAARMHQVYSDREPLELALLVALGAQLEPLPNGRPLGASILLTAPAGRGKNHIVDAAVTPLPPEFYFSFEIASGQSLYYKADEDPEFLKHTFAYPNEIEGAEALWEFLRPMLSKGWAKKIVTAKDPAGNMTTRTIIVEGPVTIAIPTIRNKTDEQLQTRLLVAELPDYVGRVKHHSATLSELLLPDAATADHSREKWLWQEGLRQLTGVRRVVFPLRHPDFALDDDQVSHGARLWANLLSLMATNAWLEQNNRRLLELGEGAGEAFQKAIEATPEDYEAAYRVFTKVCKRTVLNLSDTHRKILGGVYDLHQEQGHREGFTQREVAKAANVSLSTVSDNKTFLVTSAKLLKEAERGLALVEGGDPSWWATGDLMKGLPTPEQVCSWWEERDPPPEGAEHAEHAEHGTSADQNAHSYAANCVRRPAEQEPNAFGNAGGEHEQGAESAEHVRQMFGEQPNSENGVGKRRADDREGVFGLFGSSGDDPGMDF